MKLLACLATLGVAILCGWLIERVVGRVPQPVDAGPLPDVLFDAVWLGCDTCGHYAPHHRVGDGLVACCWCIRLSPEPKEARRG